MESLLEFRPPQFSEDGAWLPCWLQQEDNEAETSDEGLERGRFSSERCIEDYHNHRKIINNFSANHLSGEEGGYKSFHLYLSGDDSSLLSVTPSIDNMVRFHLHLSPDSSSEDMPSPSIDSFQVERTDINCDLRMKHLDVSGGTEEKRSKLNVDHKIDDINSSLVPECGGTDKDTRLMELEDNCRLSEVEPMHNAVEAIQLNVGLDVDVIKFSLAPECAGTDQDKSLKGLEENTILLEAEQVNEAVEMSISASEALVIHEVLRAVSFSESLPATAVLEAALQVKQARLEVWNESNETCRNWLNKEINGTSSQSVSEDLNMEDAYHGVGLSTSQYHGLQGDNLSVSQVKDTFDSENCEYDGKLISEEVQPPSINPIQHSDDFVNHKLVDIPENDLQLEQNIVIEPSDSERRDKVIEDTPLGLDTTSLASHNSPTLNYLGQTVDNYPKVDHSVQTSIESPHAKSSKIPGQYYGVSSTVRNRFQSRWFGGWSSNDTGFSIPVGYNNKKIIAKPFVGETSYLSESADTAPDESSFVGPKQDERANFASQSTIPSEGLYMKENDRAFLSQDVSERANFVDPLCSFVPCSIPSQNMPSPSALCDERANMEKCFISGTEHVTENFQNSNPDNKVLQEQFSVSETRADRSEHPVNRRLTSLRSLSVLLPGNGTLLEKGDLNKTFSPKKSDTLQHLQLPNSANTVHELPLGPQKEMSSHLMLNSKAKGSMQHSDEAIGKQIEGSETSAGIAPNLNPLNVQSIHEKQITASFGTRKRVRLTETENKAPRREKRQKQQITSTSNTCHTTRGGKCLRLPSSRFASRAQNLKGHLSNTQAKFEKKSLFQCMKFLLTGFPKQKEKRIEGLIKKNGGTVLYDIPSSENHRKRSSKLIVQELPIVLCSKKLQTMKFLYGCAVGAMMVKARWLTDSISASSLLPPQQYMILQKSVGEGSIRNEISVKHCSHNSIFDGIGVMLYGAKKFCTEMARIIKHGGAIVFKTLQNLVLSLDAAKITIGVVVTEDESWASRHLKQCTLEKRIPIMPVNWIVNSLHEQKLLPFTEKKDSSPPPVIKLPDTCGSISWSQEI